MKSIWKYKDWLPWVKESCQISIGEGATPLVKSKHIGPSLGLDKLYFKLENLNPTGSYKDRFAAVAVSMIREAGVGFCLATSSGNTGAALAAYSTVAQVPCVLAIVDGAPEGKLAQMRVYGAETIMVKDFGKDESVTKEVMALLHGFAKQHNTIVQVSAYCYSDEGMKGVQTISYEIAERLPVSDMHVFVPAGGGGLTLAICRGFDQWAQAKSSFVKPIIHCVQPEGNDTIVAAIRTNAAKAKGITSSKTLISGLQVPNVLDGDAVVEHANKNAGRGHSVGDADVFLWQQRMAREEGIYCEPAGAVALAGVAEALRNGEINASDTVVCIVTGHGFKDPVSTKKMAGTTDMRFVDNLIELELDIVKKIKR